MAQESSRHLEVVSMLEKNELEIARLYDIFAGRFPEHGEFWKARAADERAHAGVIGKILGRVRDGGLDLKNREFKAVEIKYCLKKVKNQVDFCESNEVSLISAFQRAAETERDMLERHLFETVTDDPPELVECLTKLRLDTETHAEAFREMLKKL
jgi:hypothetical protein